MLKQLRSAILLYQEPADCELQLLSKAGPAEKWALNHFTLNSGQKTVKTLTFYLHKRVISVMGYSSKTSLNWDIL